jgi:uncharacterized protein
MHRRNIIRRVQESLTDTPVILLNGGRQTGKSTLAQQLIEDEPETRRYLTMDDATVLAAAESDADGFVRGLDGPVVLDEVQRVPALFRAIKAAVDPDRTPGRFLLTGSADVLLLPTVSESLAGRIEILTLWPFSQGELESHIDRFAEAVFADKLPAGQSVDRKVSTWDRIVRGGFPEAVERASRRRRSAWYQAYVTTVLQRDVRDISNITGLTALPKLLRLLATRAGQLLNLSEISRSSGLPYATLNRYMNLLETTFLIQTLPAWSTNVGKRLVKSPKLLFSDTGLAAHLVGFTGVDTSVGHPLAGPMLENFVAMELTRQLTWADDDYSLYHFRTHTGQEVDLVLEDPSGRIVGIEVKASATVSPGDFKGLRALSETAGTRMHRGVLLYLGDEVISFGEDVVAVPVEAVWGW